MWHIGVMHESHWVKWIHGVYTKGGIRRIFNPPPTASWTLRKICQMRDQLREWVFQDTYSISSVYSHCIEQSPLVRWDKLVWNRTSIPKSHFILQLAMLDKLKTKTRLCALGVISEDLCPICGLAPEITNHLFFHCHFSRSCI